MFFNLKFAKILLPIIIVFSLNLSLGAASNVKLGIDVLRDSSYKCLKGKRVGLLTNPAGVDSGRKRTADILFEAKEVKLVALYGGEHGYDGTAKANEHIPHRVDKETGLHIYSLYGKTRRATTSMLKNIDVMVVDLQDVGCKAYTYVSCLLYTMEGCFENGVEVIVLDRPNPLGGEKVGGPLMDTRWLSYVGSYLMPHVHGMTIGELAQMAKDQLMFLGSKGKLRVIPMKGWKRSMVWKDTGLAWIPTSPHIPNVAAAMGFCMTGIGCELNSFSHGIGSDYPFRMLSYSGKKPEEIRDALKKRRIPGLTFRVTDYEDREGNRKRGAYVSISDWKKWHPTELNFHLMHLACEWSQENPFSKAGFRESLLFNKHVGSDEWWIALSERGKNVNLKYFLNKWDKQAKEFHAWSKKYWLYN